LNNKSAHLGSCYKVLLTFNRKLAIGNRKWCNLELRTSHRFRLNALPFGVTMVGSSFRSQIVTLQEA